MAGVELLGSRKSIPGWLLIGLAVLSLIADLEGFIQFGQRIGLPGWRPPSFLPWALAGLGVFYLVLLWHAEQLNEPVRQILRASAVPAVQNLGAVTREVGQILRSRGPIGDWPIAHSKILWAASRALCLQPSQRSSVRPFCQVLTFGTGNADL
jgi:hypothetical protein